jgi:hypothetical protein
MGELRNTYKILVGRPEGMIPFERPRRRWEDNIRMDLGNLGGKGWTECIWLRIRTSSRLL